MQALSLKFVAAFAVLILGVSSNACAAEAAAAKPGAQTATPWASPSLRSETVVAPNGAVTTRTAAGANALMGVQDSKLVERVSAGVYAMRGWGIAHSFAIEAPAGWIIIDTGDSTKSAAEKREKLETAVGKKIKVAAILLTHWHYADGTGAWLDEGAEVWGHENLDRNRSASSGLNVLGGTLQSRAIAQFGVLHPPSGPDAFPNMFSFGPEKFVAVSSYKAPTQLFPDGKTVDLVIAGEAVQVAPVRTDTMDSVAFYFPQRRLMVTNFITVDFVFNIYTLRGGTFRNPEVFVKDARWIESKNAETLLDIHAPTFQGQAVVREALQRSVDSVQLINDQTLRLIASGKGPREAAELLYMPKELRDGREAYGQVESHVRQVYNGNIGWFDGDVYDINPLAVREEAERTVQAMGGRAAVTRMAVRAATDDGFANWRWALKLTSMLLTLDPADAKAQAARAKAARALGQRTDSANARGFYITEALQMEGKLQIKGQPVTLDAIRTFLNTPTADSLAAASLDQNLQFVRFLVDPRKAEGQRQMFTLAVEGDPSIRQIELRNGVLVITEANAKAPTHLQLTRQELAAFVIGTRATAKADALTQLDRVLDRSHLMPPGAVESVMKGMKGTGEFEH